MSNTRPRMNVDELREKVISAIEAAGAKRRGPPPAPDTLAAAVFILADHGIPTDEIAISLDRSPNYVKVIKSRLRKQLSQRPVTDRRERELAPQREPFALDKKLAAHFRRIGILDADGEIDIFALNERLAPLREIAEPEKPTAPSARLQEALAFSMANLK